MGTGIPLGVSYPEGEHIKSPSQKQRAGTPTLVITGAVVTRSFFDERRWLGGSGVRGLI